MRAHVVVAALLLLVACSRHELVEQKAAIQLRDKADRTVASLDADNNVRDRDGRVTGFYDERTRELVVAGFHQTLDGALLVGDKKVELELATGTFRAELRDDEVWINGQLFGRVDGARTSRDQMRRLGVLLVAVQMLPVQASPADAALSEPVERPAPPPPPPPPSVP